MEPPKDKEQALAGLLNGTMVTMLASVLPAVMIWQIARHWREMLSAGLVDTAIDSALGIGLLVASISALRFGVRMLRLNWTALRRL
ncbi:hypothetical protein [Brevundimonas sp.]|uniref:hypothetical protein n=1 Tax=Brevundimonas sp. TaxID=1871086 RepID=UPI001DC5F029|nr:hypothetical protein [Brevundimonas sp.]MBL0946976.1 hypothetical protein [Brevundimonas sp.]